MKKSRMGSNPLDMQNPIPATSSLEWIQDSRSDDAPAASDTTERSQERLKIDETPVPVQSMQAVVLSGGGATGAFEVGVLKALVKGMSPATDRQPFSFDVITGTSVGAFNATCMVLHDDPEAALDQLEDFWLNRISSHKGRTGNGIFRFRPPAQSLFSPEALMKNPTEILSRLGADSIFLTRDWLQRGLGFFQSSEPIEHRALEMMNLSSYVSIEPLQELLEDAVPLDIVRRARPALKVVTTNWETGEAVVFDKEQLTDDIGHKAIMASTALPGFFPPVDINGHLYCDGVVVMNTPTLPAIRAGADVLHMIYMDPDVKEIPLAKFRNTLDTFDRMLSIQFAININKDIEQAERINRGLVAMERAQGDESEAGQQTQDFVKTPSQIQKRLATSRAPHKKLCIHRYHPRGDLSGILGMLNFKRENIEAYIERGIKEAVEHDCEASGCVLPE